MYEWQMAIDKKVDSNIIVEIIVIVVFPDHAHLLFLLCTVQENPVLHAKIIR